MTKRTVTGHELPAELASALGKGAWPFRISAEQARSVFGEEADPDATMYTREEMVSETSSWSTEADPAYLGHADESLDPLRSVLIGDLGHDRPIGIDLRSAPPCVRFLTIDGRWIEVATSFVELLRKLGRV